MLVKGEKFKKSILTALADDEMVKIMNCVSYNSKPITDIIKETGIPHTTVYRKINWMLQKGLLIIDKYHITLEGKKFSLIRSVLKSIIVEYQPNNTTIKADYNVDIHEKKAERFYSLDSNE